MKTRSTSSPITLLLALLLACGVATFAFSAEARADDNPPPRASVDGKYSKLLKVIDCPRDEKSYGSFKDYGKYPATKWCGDMAPAGYWVYLAPKWYIWGEKGTAKPKAPEGEVPSKASVDGKYEGLLKVIDCPRDEKSYGSFKDYGKYPATKWCGDMAPAGYWVYVAPKWYIWSGKTK